MVPPPDVGHQALLSRLTTLLESALDDTLVVVEGEALDLHPKIQPADVVLSVEVVSPSSVTNDRITKPAQYARRGMLFDTFFANPEFRDRFLLYLSETYEEFRQGAAG